MVNPVTERRKELEVGKFPLLACWLNFFLVLLIHIVHCLGNDLATETDPDNLTLKQMSFGSFEMGVGEDRSIQISTKDILDASRSVHLTRCNYREFFPFALE